MEQLNLWLDYIEITDKGDEIRVVLKISEDKQAISILKNGEPITDRVKVNLYLAKLVNKIRTNPLLKKLEEIRQTYKF